MCTTTSATAFEVDPRVLAFAGDSEAVLQIAQQLQGIGGFELLLDSRLTHEQLLEAFERSLHDVGELLANLGNNEFCEECRMIDELLAPDSPARDLTIRLIAYRDDGRVRVRNARVTASQLLYGYERSFGNLDNLYRNLINPPFQNDMRRRK